LQAQSASLQVDAGPYHGVCPGITPTFTLGGNPTASGGNGTYTYQWQPTTSLNNSTIANPIASPTVTTTYTVTVTSNGETKPGTVTIYFYNYSVNAGRDTTISQGQTITMHAQAPGASTINWSCTTSQNIYNQNTGNPDVFPSATATYTVAGTFFPGNCIVYDYVTVNVIQGNNLFFFNTFTPNGDGANDVFYIGNLEKYPDNILEIYNRYGQKLFSKTPYQNDWNGTFLNTELPAGTYFYILDTRSDTGGVHKGTVTIVK